MGIGVGIFLFALGAILAFAVNVTISAVNIETVGVILMLVGATGTALSMIYRDSWGGLPGSRRTEITESEAGPTYVGAGRRVVRDERVQHF